MAEAVRPTDAETLLAVSQAVGSTLELREVVRRTTRALVRALGADAGGAWVLEPGQARLMPLAGYHVPLQFVTDRAAAAIDAAHPLVEAAKQANGPVHASDSAADPRFDHPVLARLAHRSVLLQPMWRKGEMVGCFAIVWLRTAHGCTEGELRLADGIARQAAVALENARLYEEAQRGRREAEVLADVARTINASLDIDTVLQRVTEAARDLCGSDVARLALWDAAAQAVTIRYRAGDPRDQDARLPVEPWKGIGGLVLATGRPFRTDDYEADTRISKDYVETIRQLGVVAALAVPVRIGDKVQGLLYVGNRSRRPFTDSDQGGLLRLAEQAGVAIRNGRLYDEAGRRRQAAESLFDVGRLVSQSLDPQEVQRRVADSVRRLLDARRAWLFQLDAATGTLTVLAASADASVPPGADPMAGLAAVRLAVSDRRPVGTPDFLTDPRLTSPVGSEAETDRAVLAVPLLVGAEVVGALAVRDRVGRLFAADDARLLEAFADEAAIALENARLYAESRGLLADYRRRVEELSVLYDLSRVLTGQLDIDRLANALLREISRIMDAGSMLVLLYDETRRELEVALELVDGVPRPALTRYAAGVGLSSWVAEHRQPIRTDDYAAACREAGVAPVTGALAFPHWLGVPMIAGDMVVGVLALRSATRPFSEADARLLTNIAGLAALTVRSARLHAATTHAYDQLSRAQEQLAQSRKMEAIGRLAGGVAHDFNNLLTVIKGRSQLILDRLEPEHPLRRQISLIEQMAERAAALTRQLLAFSRRQTLEPRVLSVNLVVQGLTPMLGRLLGEDIELVVGLDPGLAVVRADPNQLEQVVLNLVANARDAMPDGGRLTIETANAELTEDSIEPPHDVRPGPYVRLTVRDSGVGMDIATQARLFEPFFTTKEVGRGTGLGLATVYGIVRQSGGTITVHSVAGRGSTFDVYLPCAADVASPAAAVTTPAVIPDRGWTVLLVEDEDAVRDLAREILQERGYAVLEARNGREAIEVAARTPEPISLLLTDVVMPGMMGPELARRLTAGRPGLKVLYVSGHPDRAVGSEARAPGLFLHKPFSPEALAAKVREALDPAG
jgi:signal transduction histidine kinase/CheY-like chemotaxis protein